MSKKNIDSAPVPAAENTATEIVDPAAERAAKLAAIGDAITDADLRDAEAAAEKKKGEFAIAAIRLGLMLEAKFAAISAENSAANLRRGSRMATRCHSGNSETFPQFCARVFGAEKTRSLRGYRMLARRWFDAATEPQHAHGSELAKSLHEACNGDAGGGICTLIADCERALPIADFVAGRSLRRLIDDLRRADEDAEEEEAAEARAEAAQEAAKRVERLHNPTAATIPDIPPYQQTLNLLFLDAEQSVERVIGGFDEVVKADPPRKILETGIVRIVKMLEAQIEVFRGKLDALRSA